MSKFTVIILKFCPLFSELSKIPILLLMNPILSDGGILFNRCLTATDNKDLELNYTLDNLSTNKLSSVYSSALDPFLSVTLYLMVLYFYKEIRNPNFHVLLPSYITFLFSPVQGFQLRWYTCGKTII